MPTRSLHPITSDIQGNARRPSLHINQRLNTKYGYVLTDTRRVTRKHHLLLVINYPFDWSHEFKLTRRGGWTMGQLITAIQDAYQKLYKTPVANGVWGHGINDLVIERINVHSDTERTITLDIGS